MGKRGYHFEDHDFYCMKCGQKGIPIARNLGHKHASMHKKKLYCIHCKEEVNHIECSNPLEVKEFQKKFRRGEYKDEANASLSYVRSVRIG